MNRRKAVLETEEHLSPTEDDLNASLSGRGLDSEFQLIKPIMNLSGFGYTNLLAVGLNYTRLTHVDVSHNRLSSLHSMMMMTQMKVLLANK